MCKNGHPVWVRLNVSAVRTETGEFQYSVRVAEDISEKKASEHILKEYHAKLDQSNKDLEHFAFRVLLEDAQAKIKRYNEVCSHSSL